METNKVFKVYTCCDHCLKTDFDTRVTISFKLFLSN